VCDIDGDDPDDNRCVQCTGLQYDACSDGGIVYVCDSSLRTCSTEHGFGTAGPCYECVSDAHCADGLLCVPMTFGEPATAIGNFCQWIVGGGGGAPTNCTDNGRPYSKSATGAPWTDHHC
jgi:hypothetical protein